MKLLTLLAAFNFYFYLDFINIETEQNCFRNRGTEFQSAQFSFFFFFQENCLMHISNCICTTTLYKRHDLHLTGKKNIDYANFVIKTLSIMMISDMPIGNFSFFSRCLVFHRGSLIASCHVFVSFQQHTIYFTIFTGKCQYWQF